jgi:lauroyl/myristoyl acyltransferase
MRTMEILPFPAQRHVGFALGRLIRRLPLAYVRIARRNIQLCMPALSPTDQADLLDRHWRICRRRWPEAAAPS